MAEKCSWDQANIRQKLGLVWRNRKNRSQLSKTTFLAVLPLNYSMDLGKDRRRGISGMEVEGLYSLDLEYHRLR